MLVKGASTDGVSILSGVNRPGFEARAYREGVNVTFENCADTMRIRPYEEHHLNKPTFVEQKMRDVIMWFDRVMMCGCGLGDGMISDLQEEERFQKEVLRVRTTPFIQDGCGVTLGYRREMAHRDLMNPPVVAPEPARVMVSSIMFGDVETPLEHELALPAPEEGEDVVVKTNAPVEEYSCPLVSARVVGVVVSAVDMKVGTMLPHTLESRLVVERHARLLMRERNFRNADISLHLPHVVECYFQSREFLQKAGTRRRRANAWILELLGFKTARIAAQ